MEATGSRPAPTLYGAAPCSIPPSLENRKYLSQLSEPEPAGKEVKVTSHGGAGLLLGG